MRFLKTNTATRVTVGPFLDHTDGKTPETSLTVTGCHLTLMVDDGGVPTLALDADATASSGNNDMVHVTNDDAGFYDLELTAAQVNYLGRAMLCIVDADVHLPVFHEFMILTANAYDTMFGTDKFDVNVEEWNATAVPSEHTAGYPIATIKDGTGTGELDTASGAVIVQSGTGTGQISLSSGTVTTGAISANAITATAIADDAITAAKLNTGAITADAFAADAIVAATLATGALTADAFAADALVAATFATGALTADAFAANAITNAAVADDVDVNVKTITNGAITAAAIATGAIDADAIADGAIDAGAIADAAIDAATFAADVWTRLGIVAYGTAQAATSTTLQLASASAFADDELNGAVVVITGGTGVGQSRLITNYTSSTDTADVDTWTTTPSGTITYVVFAAAPASATSLPAVNVTQFGGSAGTFSGGRPEVNTTHAAGTAWGSGAITAASIATGAIDADAIADNAIDAGAIASNAITDAKIATGAITAAKFAAGAIDAAALAADAGTEIGTAVWATTTRVLTANTNLNDPTAATIADAVWDEAIADHQTAGSTGELLQDIDDEVDYIHSVVDNIAVTGSALTMDASAFTKAVGGTEVNDYTSTALANGTTHDIPDVTGQIDVYYQFDIGASGTPSKVDVIGRLETTVPASGNSINLYAYNWTSPGWDLIHAAVFAPTTSTTALTTHSESLLSRHVGTGTDDGKVRIRFYNTGLKSGATTLEIDQILVEYAETIAGSVASILADTNELQTDWVDGGRLDLLLDAKPILTTVIESQGSVTLQQVLQALLAACAGVTADSDTSTMLLKTPNGGATRITATLDGTDRTAITLSFS